MQRNKAILFTLIATTSVALAQSPAEERVLECSGEVTTGRKAAFREIIVLTGSTAKIGDRHIPLSSQTDDYFDYVSTQGKNGYQLTLFRKTGRFKYSTFLGRLQVAEGNCRKVERSKVFE